VFSVSAARALLPPTLTETAEKISARGDAPTSPGHLPRSVGHDEVTAGSLQGHGGRVG